MTADGRVSPEVDRPLSHPGEPRSPRPGRVACLLVAAMLTSGAALGAAGCADDSELAGTNLLLVTVDTLRADHVGAWGHPFDDTPAIDRLAREGVRFSRALSPAPTTLPTHASILTGTTPPRHGIRDNSAGLLPAPAVTLAEAFREAGHDTGAFVGAYVLDARWGLSQGFDVYDDPEIPADARELLLAEAERPAGEVVEAATGWLAGRGDAPWFAWIHLYDPHAPYRPPEPWASSHAARRYDGEIAYVDSLLAGLRTTLEERGAWPDTTVLLTSDHGEALGEHEEPTHGFFVYEEVLHVPLLLRPADGAGTSMAPGTVVDTPVTLVDLLPTIAELWGLEIPEEVQGRSLLGALRGREITNFPVYSETFVPRLHFGWSELYAITAGPERFIEAPTPELYDLADDPDESVNLASSRPERVRELREVLEERLAGSGTEESGPGVDPQRLEALRSLGYLSVGGADGGALPDPKDKIGIYNRVNRAMSRWQQGDPEAALEEIDAIIADDPGFAGARHFRGQILLSTGDEQGAEAAFREALEIDPAHDLAARELLRIHRARGELAAAEDLLRDLLALRPEDTALRGRLGGILIVQGRLDEAEAALREGLERAPGAPRLHATLGQIALARGRPDEALEALDRAVAGAPDLAGIQLQRGRALELLQRQGEALEAYREETSNDPDGYAAWIGRARVATRLGLARDAVESLRTATEIRPDGGEPRVLLARALLDLDPAAHLNEAQELVEAGLPAVADAGIRAVGHLTLARIYEARGRTEDAQAQRREAERLRGRDE